MASQKVRYYVNNECQPTGDYEVHTETCPHLQTDSRFLGEYPSCYEAVKEAKKYHLWANGCNCCSLPCHLG